MNVGDHLRLTVLAAVLTTASVAFAECSITVSQGYDFTNATLAVEGVASGAITLLDSSNQQVAAHEITSTPCVFSPTLLPGHLYTYTIAADELSAPLLGDILAANWNDSFTTSSSGDTNGSWSPSLDYVNGVAAITGATFAVESSPPTNAIVAVEAIVSVSGIFDNDEELDATGANALIVACTNSAAGGEMQWRAWPGGSSCASVADCTTLFGATPVIGQQVTVRTTFDFTSPDSPKVRFQVKAQDESSFTSLADADGNAWLALGDAASTLDAVRIVGNVPFFSMSGQVSNADLLLDENGRLTLLTNLTRSDDTEIAASRNLTLDLAGHDCLLDSLNIRDNATLTITNAASDVGCVAISSLTKGDNAALLIAGGLWENALFDSSLAPNLAFCRLASDVTHAGRTFAYQVKAAQTVEIDGVTAKIDDDFGKSNIDGWSGMDDAARATALTATGKNGLRKIDSYALSLDPSDESSVPVVASALDAANDKMTISLGNIRVNEGAGVPVRFALRSANSPANLETAAPGETQTSPSFSADLPSSGDNVMYYTIDVQIGN